MAVADGRAGLREKQLKIVSRACSCWRARISIGMGAPLYSLCTGGGRRRGVHVFPLVCGEQFVEQRHCGGRCRRLRGRLDVLATGR